MTDEQIILDDGSPELYVLGRLVAHSSDGFGLPDVGISVGLGNGQMLYAGDLPNPFSTGLKLYSQDTSILIADKVDYEIAQALIEALAGAICTALNALDAEALRLRAIAAAASEMALSGGYFVDNYAGKRSDRLAAAIDAYEAALKGGAA